MVITPLNAPFTGVTAAEGHLITNRGVWGPVIIYGKGGLQKGKIAGPNFL